MSFKAVNSRPKSYVLINLLHGLGLLSVLAFTNKTIYVNMKSYILTRACIPDSSLSEMETEMRFSLGSVSLTLIDKRKI